MHRSSGAAAEALEPVTTVVTLATQRHGAQPVVGRLGPDCSLLLLHGDADTVLSSDASVALFRDAREPRAMHIYPGGGHVLDEVAEKVHGEVKRWLLKKPSSDQKGAIPDLTNRHCVSGGPSV